jgi:hypothetical protein
LLVNFWYASKIFLSLASIRGRWRSCFCLGTFFAGGFILSLAMVFFASGFVLLLVTFFFAGVISFSLTILTHR